MLFFCASSPRFGYINPRVRLAYGFLQSTGFQTQSLVGCPDLPLLRSGNHRRPALCFVGGFRYYLASHTSWPMGDNYSRSGQSRTCAQAYDLLVCDITWLPRTSWQIGGNYLRSGQSRPVAPPYDLLLCDITWRPHTSWRIEYNYSRSWQSRPG